MARTIRLEHRYDTDPDRVWAMAKDFSTLEQMNSGSVAMRGLPVEPVREGETITFEVKPFYARSWKPYHVEMLEVNDAERRFVSLEYGAGVKTWRHTLTVEPDGYGARQVDEIAIDAGPMTWAVALLAQRMYRKRDPVRRRLLGLDARVA